MIRFDGRFFTLVHEIYSGNMAASFHVSNCVLLWF